MAILKRALWLLAIVSAVAAMYILIHAIWKAPTEQELANCAMIALAVALVPYCLARAVAESRKRSD
jgi:hypothetical protein